MATTTTNLGLSKPAYSDDADVAVINGNMDILDTKIGAVGNTSVQAQINTNSQAIAKYTTADGTLTNINMNLNDLKESGRYYAVNQCTNLPVSNVPGYLDVYVLTNSYVRQSFRSYNSEKVYERACNNGTWTSWQELALNSKIADFRAYTANWRSYTTLTSALAANQSVYSDYSIVLVNATLSGGAMYFGYIFKKDSSNMFAQFWSTTGIATNLQTTDGGNTWA